MLARLALALGLLLPRPAHAERLSSRTFYLDCGKGDDAAAGDSPSAAWGSLDRVSRQAFSPGDRILLRRGTQCEGALWPKGSGQPQAPITLSAYGAGPRPVIKAGSRDAALKLFNQQYWEISSLDLSGGQPRGVFISGDKGVLRHIRLTDLSVHDVGGEPQTKDTGLVIIAPGAAAQRFEDVSIDGVTAYNTSQWAGILVGTDRFGYPPEESRSAHVTVRNSIVHDVAGDGIVLFGVNHGSIASSAAWRTGMQWRLTLGTPNAIWTWMCRDCAVEGNEAFLTDSPSVDGGAFDMDYGDADNAVRDNYGHDTQGYCVAAFGAAGFHTTGGIIRGNVCERNGLSPRQARNAGAVYLLTWSSGTIDGLVIEGNTILWDPPGATPALVCDARSQGLKNLLRDNDIISRSPLMIDSNDALELSGNRYVRPGSQASSWIYDGRTYGSFEEYRRRSRQDAGSTLKTGPAARPDLDHGPISGDIDRIQDLRGQALPLSRFAGQWALISFLQKQAGGRGLEDGSRSRIVTLKSLREQYRAALQSVVVLEPDAQGGAIAADDAVFDWGLEDFVLARPAQAAGPGGLRTFLLSPQGRIVRQWRGAAGPALLSAAVRRELGEPAYSDSPMMPRR